ncbi:hypothetical protein K8R61_02915 [bacterium]|nr:hypothetical protein [bacterium]
MSKECDSKSDSVKEADVTPISKDDFLREYPIYEKPIFNVDIGVNSCGICS